MATYIQGVTDYIPDYQPFQPDFNFYSNFLQYKQNQYDTNWKSLSNLYGQYFNAELTNPENIKIKDTLVKQIDFNLQRVAGLDLSLEQNVEQATQIFTPFYQDKALMRDMAYTKNFNNDLARAQALQNSKDEKEAKKYWPMGIEYMMYKKEEFAKAKREDLVNIPDTKYIPNVNAIELYLKTAKDLGISADITQTDGRYFVRKKNGDQLLQPLENIFAATFANDPALQQKYQAQAYVERKRWVGQNKDKFAGNETDAERKYLKDQLLTIQEYAKIKDSKNKTNTKQVSGQLDKVNQKLQNGQGNQFTEGYKASLEEALQIAQSTESLSDQLINTLHDQGSTSSTSTTSLPQEENLDRLRFQVEAGTASMLADRDIQDAAYSYSRVGMVVDVSADPYGVAAQNNAYRLQQQQFAHQLKMSELAKKHEYDVQEATIKAGLENGSLLTDEKGNITMNLAAYTPVLHKGKNVSATDANTSIIKENHLSFIEHTRKSADPMVRQMVRYMRDAVASKLLTKDEANKLFFGNNKGGTWSNIDEFWGKYDKHAGGYLYGLNTQKDNKLSKLYARVMQFAKAHRGDDDISANFLNSTDHGKFNEYLTFTTAMHTVNEKNHESLRKNLKSSTVFEGMDSKLKDNLLTIALTKDNGLISEDEFIKSATPLMKRKDARKFNFSALAGLDASMVQSLSPEERKKWASLSGNKISNMPKKAKQYLYGIFEYDVNTGKPLTNSKSLTSLYKDIKKNYVSSVQNSKEILSITPGIGGNANASYSPGEQEWMIYPSIIGSEGFKGWKELMTRDLGNVNWYDQTKNNISFHGNDISGVNKTKESFDDPKELVNVSEYILSKLWSQTGNKKATPFRLSSNQRAMEKRNKGSMTVYPDYKFLKELLQGDGKGMLTEDLIKTIATNGITYITDSKNWNNSVFKSNQYTPLESVVRALGSVSYEHPMGGGKYTISEDNTGVSPYTINYSLNTLNSDGSTSSDDFLFPPNTYNLEELTKEMVDAMQYMSDYNKAMSRNKKSQ